MYRATIEFERTEAERNNQLVAWQRPDKAFFAAGACHILAFTLKDLHPDRELQVVHIKPDNQAKGDHVYVLDGEWAFDFNGWTKESELLAETERAYSKVYPGWSYQRLVVESNLETFCSDSNHRPPSYFAFLPWERAYKYLEQFSPTPPT